MRVKCEGTLCGCRLWVKYACEREVYGALCWCSVWMGLNYVGTLFEYNVRVNYAGMVDYVGTL